MIPGLITVVIPTYNRAAFLRQALEGLLAQDLPPDRYEVLVIDNNSSDRTATEVGSFAQSRPEPRYIPEPRQGANHARNRAIDEAQGEIVVFVDDDVLVGPQWLRELTAPFFSKQGTRVGAVAGEVVPFFPDGCPSWVAGFHGPLAFRLEPGPIGPRQMPMSANLAFRRPVFEKIGRFEAEIGRHGRKIFSHDENFLIHRLRDAGYEVWFAPAAVARHQIPAARTRLKYVLAHGFDSARSRVFGRVNFDQAEGRSSWPYLLSRLIPNLLKAAGFLGIAFLQMAIFRTDLAKKFLVRAWRACGYLYQIPRSLAGCRP